MCNDKIIWVILFVFVCIECSNLGKLILIKFILILLNNLVILFGVFGIFCW